MATGGAHGLLKGTRTQGRGARGAACRCVADFVKSQWTRGKARGSVPGSWLPETDGK